MATYTTFSRPVAETGQCFNILVSEHGSMAKTGLCFNISKLQYLLDDGFKENIEHERASHFGFTFILLIYYFAIVCVS